ncbi:hypothetical protein CLV58_13523 [Spirosoma oryzae]|uniref:Uncharacterized protein n=1 Tax=Spirosoma oryzae TaxID=1469603 RepID=A0A2T0S0R0_9BACT|nr:hypothetical protein CLV58_13523 [Spirosoma oryzae]
MTDKTGQVQIQPTIFARTPNRAVGPASSDGDVNSKQFGGSVVSCHQE